MAALLLTEVIQNSLHVLHKPVYLLVLDAQSAFDRCLRQILVCELFKAGMRGEVVEIVNNRLTSRKTRSFLVLQPILLVLNREE